MTNTNHLNYTPTPSLRRGVFRPPTMKDKVTTLQFNAQLHNRFSPPLGYQLNAHIQTITPVYDQVNDQLYLQLRQQLCNQIATLVFQQLQPPKYLQSPKHPPTPAQ